MWQLSSGEGQRRPLGDDLGVEVAGDLASSSSSPGRAPAIVENSDMRRSVKTTLRGRSGIARCRLRRLRARAAATFLPLASIFSSVFISGMARGHGRARADRGVARDPCAESPWAWLTRSALMPSRSATSRGKIVAWPWPVDRTFIVNTRCSPPGNDTLVPSIKASRRRVPARSRCRARAAGRPFFDPRLRALKPS